jgi:hypothetical protein
MRTDGRTEITKLIIAFRNFANAPKNRRPESLPVSINFVYINRNTLRNSSPDYVSIVAAITHQLIS